MHVVEKKFLTLVTQVYYIFINSLHNIHFKTRARNDDTVSLRRYVFVNG